MSDLLKEAIADAKAVRETALANAKMALEEAFTPQLQSMLSAKLREDEDEEMEEQDDEDLEEAEDEKAEDKPVEESEEFDYNSMVAEVARRVALRLVKENSRKRK